jgi:hypothetical protein
MEPEESKRFEEDLMLMLGEAPTETILAKITAVFGDDEESWRELLERVRFWRRCAAQVPEDPDDPDEIELRLDRARVREIDDLIVALVRRLDTFRQ